MARFHYVYILVSMQDAHRRYTGSTTDLKRRLAAHNAGQIRHTASCKPWIIDIAISFRSRRKAAEFERYLKSHSGRSFAKRHF